MALGNILRTAREQQGLTTSQVADATHMLVQVVEELEREDFRRFAAAIYGRGFVRLYAEHLGIDPLPLVKEFGELYAGAQRPQIATRALQLVPATPATPATPVTVPAPPATTPAPPAPAATPPGPVATRRVPVEQEAEEVTFAPAPQEDSATRATPDNGATDALGPDLDLFSAMAAHAFGGEPMQAPTRQEPRPTVTAAPRQTAPEESSEWPPLAAAVLGQSQSGTPRLTARLTDWCARVTEFLPAPCRAQPLLSGAAAVLLLTLLIAGAVWLAQRTPAAPDTPPVPVANAVPPTTDIHLLPPPETYVD